MQLPLYPLIRFSGQRVLVTLIVHLTQPAMAVARVWKSPVLHYSLRLVRILPIQSKQ